MKKSFQPIILAIVLWAAGFGVYTLVSLHFYYKGYIFNANNASICTIILILFLTGAIWSLYLTSRLLHQEKAIYLAATANDIESVTNNLPQSWIKDAIIKIEVESTSGINSQSASWPFENEIRFSGNIVRYLAGAVTLIGLLGAFLGTIQAIKSLQFSLVKPSSSHDIEYLYNNLTQILGGLDKAFGTSISGILASIVLSFFYTTSKLTEQRVVNKLDWVTSTKFLPFYQHTRSDPVARIITESINRLLPNTIKEATEKLNESTKNLFKSTEAIRTSQSAFDLLIKAIKTETIALTSHNEVLVDQLSTFVSITSSIKGDLKAFELHLTKNQESLAEASKTNNLTSSQISEALLLFRETNQKLAEHVKSRNTEIRLIKEAFENLSSSISHSPKELNTVVESNRVLLTQASDAFSTIGKSYGQLTNYISSRDTEVKDIYTMYQEIGVTLNNISSQLESSLYALDMINVNTKGLKATSWIDRLFSNKS